MKKISLILIFLLVSVIGVFAQNNNTLTLSPTSITVEPGGTFKIDVQMKNTRTRVKSYSCTITLPDGFTFGETTFSDGYTNNKSLPENNSGKLAATHTSSNGKTHSSATTVATITVNVGANVLAGTYNLNLSNGKLNSRSNTVASGLSSSCSVTVVIPTVTANSYTIKYGDDIPSLGYEVSGGTLNGTPQISCTAKKTSPVGTYDIVVSKGTVTNSKVTYVNGKLTIEPAPLTITAKSYSREEGEENPEFEVMYSGFKNNETSAVLTKQPAVSCSATSESKAGVYDITVSGATAQNYVITHVNGKLTVTEPSTETVTEATVFDDRSSSTPHYRIPALVMLNDGSLMAFADRRWGKGDVGIYDSNINNCEIDIVAETMSYTNGRYGAWTTTYAGHTASVLAIVEGYNNTSGFDRGHGDASVVVDRESGDVLMMCASGDVSYSGSTRTSPIRVGRYYGKDNGTAWSGGDITTSIYNINSQLTKAFFSSGRMCQSTQIKVGSHYRVYAGLVTNLGTIVLYSDDFGGSWSQLGSVAYSAGDESKIVELPDGSVLVSAKVPNTVSGNKGRAINVFKYSESPTKSTPAAGSWTTAVLSCGSSVDGGGLYSPPCNGEMLIVPAKDINGNDVYVVLHSLPTNYYNVNSSNDDRANLSIYWKVFTSAADMAVPANYQTGWSRYQVSSTTSAYSSMVLGADDKVKILYEENISTPSGYWASYDIRFKSLALETITNGNYTVGEPVLPETWQEWAEYKGLVKADGATEADVAANKTDLDWWHGRVVMLCPMLTKNNQTTQFYMWNDNVNLKVTTNPEDFKDKLYRSYWVAQKDPGSNSIYFSSLVGDGYLGRTYANSYYTDANGNLVQMNNMPACVPDASSLYDITGLVTKGYASGHSGKAQTVDHVSLRFYTNQVVNDDNIRFVAIAEDGEFNWINFTTKGSLIDNKKYWSTEFHMRIIDKGRIGEFGTVDAPTCYGYPVTFHRTEVLRYQDDTYDYFSTLKLPYAVVLPPDVIAYQPEITSLEVGATVNLVKILEGTTENPAVLPRETPVILCMKNTAANPETSETSKTIYLTPALAKDITHPATDVFKGTLGKENIESKNLAVGAENGAYYYVLSKNKGHLALRYTTSKTINANKAYYVTSTAQSALSFKFVDFDDDLTTSIKLPVVRDEDDSDAPIYDMCGRRLQSVPAKGIYIKGGRKYVVR
ncbi:MAG: MBG domain-containing protein [Prevotella sp.]|nr:MBG domain-containing protein [Prevotella sp.]